MYLYGILLLLLCSCIGSLRNVICGMMLGCGWSFRVILIMSHPGRAKRRLFTLFHYFIKEHSLQALAYSDLICYCISFVRVDEKLSSLGWERIYDKNREDYKLKWCEVKANNHYHAFREGACSNKWLYCVRYLLCRENLLVFCWILQTEYYKLNITN